MARTRKTELDVVVSPTGAAPARRKSPTSTTRKKFSDAAGDVAPAVNLEAASQETATDHGTSEPVIAPAHEEIAALAYSYWEARGYQGGSPEEDWLRAVQELRHRVLEHA